MGHRRADVVNDSGTQELTDHHLHHMRKDEIRLSLMALVFCEVLDDHAQDVVDYESDHGHEDGQESSQIFIL
jgi:hypothetical protein